MSAFWPADAQSLLAPPSAPGAGVAELFWIFVAALAAVYLAVAIGFAIALLRANVPHGGEAPDDRPADVRLARAVLVASAVSAVVLLALLLVTLRTERALASDRGAVSASSAQPPHSMQVGSPPSR